MSARAQKIRDASLDIGLKLIEKGRTKTAAVRWPLSRASMVGRIDMASLWSGFSPLPEKPGDLVSDSLITSKVSESNFDFLYSFANKGKQYRVIRIGE